MRVREDPINYINYILRKLIKRALPHYSYSIVAGGLSVMS